MDVKKKHFVLICEQIIWRIDHPPLIKCLWIMLDVVSWKINTANIIDQWSDVTYVTLTVK